jgi:hypothetical protein
MQVLKARDKYFEVCNDRYAFNHYLEFRKNTLGEKIVAEWLATRMVQDMTPLKNLDGTDVVEAI